MSLLDRVDRNEKDVLNFQNETVIKLNSISTSMVEIQEMNKKLNENIQNGSGNSDMKFTLLNETLDKKFTEFDNQFVTSSNRMTKLEDYNLVQDTSIEDLNKFTSNVPTLIDEKNAENNKFIMGKIEDLER